MHVPLRQPNETLHKTWRHQAAVYYFDSDRATELINRIKGGDAAAMDALLRYAEPLLRSLISYRRAAVHVPLDEILSSVQIKLWKSLRLFDASRGTAYSFVAKVAASVMASAISEAWQRAERLIPIDEATDSASVTNPLEHFEAIAEIEFKVRQVKTGVTDRDELSAQRWFVESFIDAGFRLRRHEMADSAMKVYGLDHARSRQLFDLIMVGIRRELLSIRRLAPIRPASLIKTRSEAIIGYARYLSADEFTRLAVLLRNVAPSVIFTVNPLNTAAMRRGEKDAIRENLLIVLRGAPTDQPLFG